MSLKNKMLSFAEIVTRADAETLRAALEARIQIDDLLLKRDEAYRKIAEVESKIQDLTGDELEFEFDEPQYPVAWAGKSPKKKVIKKKVAKVEPEVTPEPEVPAEEESAEQASALESEIYVDTDTDDEAPFDVEEEN